MLKEVMRRLLANVGQNEEIIVIDGASADGTRRYLEELQQQGEIHQFVSEPDEGESHGWNKGLLLARGEVIKLLSDDDSFDWKAIRTCQEYLLAHPDVDLVATNGGDFDFFSPDSEISIMDYEPYVEQWRQSGLPFAFCGLGLMIRRRSLALTGLFHTGIARADAEFGLRVTSLPANLHWWTGYGFVRILHASSNTYLYRQRIAGETQRLEHWYEGQAIDLKLPGRARFRQAAGRLKRRLAGAPATSVIPKGLPNWPAAFAKCDRWLGEINQAIGPRFLPGRIYPTGS